MSSSSDPNSQGGSLSDMAVEGTTVSGEAAIQRTIPSVARLDQIPTTVHRYYWIIRFGRRAQDIGRTTQDSASTSDVATGTGAALPSEIGWKGLQNMGNSDLRHGRYDKHIRQKGSDQEKGASDGAAEDEVVDGVVGGR